MWQILFASLLARVNVEMTNARLTLFNLCAILLCWALSAPCGHTATFDGGLLSETIQVSGKAIYTWPEGSVRVFQVVDDTRIKQGNVLLGCANAVIWFNEPESRKSGFAQCRVYAEVGVRVVRDGKVEQYQQLLADFVTAAGLSVDGPILTYENRQESPLLARAEAVRATQKPGFTSTAAVPPDVQAREEVTEPEELEIFADNVESWVEGDTRIVVATGNVSIRKHMQKGEAKKKLQKEKKAKKDESQKKEPSAGFLDTEAAYELTAERVVLWMPVQQGEKGRPELREVYAEGEVTLYRDEDVLRADQLFHNVVENRGLMTNAEIRTMDPKSKLPFVLRADEVRQLDLRRYVAKNGSVTTDPYGKPHFKFKAQRMRIIQGRRKTVLSGTHNTFQIGDVPVAYWPFISKDLKDDSWMIRDIAVGASTGLGAFVLTEWDLYDLGIYRNDWSLATLRLDLYTRRGLGLGPKFEYLLGDHGAGFVEGYYIHDSEDFDRSKLQIESPDRGRLLARHRQLLPSDWRFDFELAYLSDRGFLNEYFRKEYSEGKPQETVQYFRKIKDNAGLTLLFQEKINDFEPMTFRNINPANFTVDSYLESPLYDTTVQKFPELGYHHIGQPFFGGLLNYSTDTRFGALNLQYDNDLIQRLHTLRHQNVDEPNLNPANLRHLQDPPTLARLDTRHDLSIPLDLGPVRVDPMLHMRLQAVSSSVKDGPGGVIEDGGAAARLIAGPQIVATTNFWRIYDVHNSFLDINRIKHIITPQIRYENAAVVTDDPDNFYNFDAYGTVVRRNIGGVDRLIPVVPLPRSFNDFDRVESMDHMQRLVFELRQRLQTKRGRPGYEETVDLAELRLSYNVFPGNEGLNRSFKEVYGDYIRADAFWRVSKNIILEARDNEWNVTDGQWETAHIGLKVLFPPNWTVSAGQRYIREVREQIENGVVRRQDRNVSYLSLEYTISPRYAVTFVQQYDLEANKNHTTKVTVSRKLPGWVLDFTADVNPVDNETSFNVQLKPLGLSRGGRGF